MSSGDDGTQMYIYIYIHASAKPSGSVEYSYLPPFRTCTSLCVCLLPQDDLDHRDGRARLCLLRAIAERTKFLKRYVERAATEKLGLLRFWGRRERTREGESMTDGAPDAWYMDDRDDVDQREPHRLEPNERVSGAKLRALGVTYWKLDADRYENDADLEKIRVDRGYNYQDIITVSKDKLPGYEEKIKIFFEEHIHEDEEIRYILDGRCARACL